MRSTFASRIVLGFVLAQGSMWVAAQTAAPRQGHRWPTVAMDSDIQARRDLRPANFSAKPFMANGAADSVRDFHIVRHDVLVDGPRNEAIFNLWLSEEPDFEAVDEVGRQSHSFQYFVDTPDFGAFYRRLGGGAEQLQPLVLIRGEEIHYNGSLIAREIEPFYDPTTDPASGGWGPVVATMAVKQDRKRVSFSLPLSVFDGENGSGPVANSMAIHYFLELYRFGATTSTISQATAKVATVDAPIAVWPQGGRAPRSNGHPFVVVRILTTTPSRLPGPSFLAGNVDVSTLELGPDHGRARWSTPFDVDSDGDLDLLVLFNAADLGLSCIDTDVRLTGEVLEDGIRKVFVGVDANRVVECHL